MHLIPDQPNPKKWENFYKDMAANSHRSAYRLQRGGGGTLGPRIHPRHYTSVKDTVAPKAVSPTEMVVQQAKSEVKKRQKVAGQGFGPRGVVGTARRGRPPKTASGGGGSGGAGGSGRGRKTGSETPQGVGKSKKAINTAVKRKRSISSQKQHPVQTKKKLKSDIFY